jgi:hypothetical protein
LKNGSSILLLYINKCIFEFKNLSNKNQVGISNFIYKNHLQCDIMKKRAIRSFDVVFIELIFKEIEEVMK